MLVVCWIQFSLTSRDDGWMYPGGMHACSRPAGRLVVLAASMPFFQLVISKQTATAMLVAERPDI
jgi:hypothetical protein